MQINNNLQIFQQISSQAAASAASQQNPRQQQAQSLTERPVDKSRRKDKGRMKVDPHRSQDQHAPPDMEQEAAESNAPGRLLDVHA